jgi:hypothetical protein
MSGIRVSVVVTPEEHRRVAKIIKYRFIDMPQRFATKVAKPLAIHARDKAMMEVWRLEGPVFKWVPLRPVTLARKAELGFPRDILVRTKALRRSLVNAADRNNITRFIKQSEGHFTILLGSKDPKFHWHHLGAPAVNLPARPLMPSYALMRKWAERAHGELLVPSLEEDIKRMVW